MNVSQIISDFPALTQKVNGKPLLYLDSAASALKPKPVIDVITQFYSYEAANVHRGIHQLSAQATEKFEESRLKVQKFIGANSEREIIYTKGTTESVNLIAHSWGRQNLKKGDAILLTEMEHHSNLVPWQILADEMGLEIRFVSVTDSGELDLESFKELVKGAKLVSVSHCSNTLGTINPIKELAQIAHENGALISVDGAQSITFLPIDVRDLDCDFFSFSAHKLFGPYGLGILYGKEEILKDMTPYQGGGSMIETVTTEGSTFNDIPFRFEAGTPHISGAIALGAAIDYLDAIGMQNIAEHEAELTQFALEKLSEVEGIRIIGNAKERAPIFSFVIDGIHANDIGEILDQEGVAVRTGHHCTQPLMKRFDINSTVRASFSIYNTSEDVECLIKSLKKCQDMLG